MTMRNVGRFCLTVTMFFLLWTNKMTVLAVDPFAACGGAGASNPRVDTALGCVPVTMESFIPWILKYLFGIAGGIAFLLMVYGFILIGTSSGDEKKVQGARETITSAVTGLLVSIFGLFILNLIGKNILQLPGF